MKTDPITLPIPTPEGVEKFKEIYKRHFGEDLDDQRALELAIRTLHFVYLAITPAPVPVVERVTPKADRRG